MNIKNCTLFIAKNLNMMRGINSECIGLIYLDPPFNTKKRITGKVKRGDALIDVVYAPGKGQWYTQPTHR